MSSQENIQGKKLGDFVLELAVFPKLQQTLDIEEKHILCLLGKDRQEKIHALLLHLITQTPSPCFLLAAVSEFIQEVIKRKWVESYTFSQFEFWLNHLSGLSEEDNYQVRAKIMGRYVPREAYQSLFPIGMGKRYAGSHYVTAHSSPDLDTTVASFWGWVDAFAARVGTGLHIWNIPGGAPKSQVEIDFLFYQTLGKECFSYFTKTRTFLALSAIDLIMEKSVMQRKMLAGVEQIDDESSDDFTILVDDKGYYIGDWKEKDREGVRKVNALLHHCMRWFVGHFQRKLSSVLSQTTVTKEHIICCIHDLFAASFLQAEPIKEFTLRQKEKLSSHLMKTFVLPRGSESSFGQFWGRMKELSIQEFADFSTLVETLPYSPLFDAKGYLVENRSIIFQHLEKISMGLEKALQSLRLYVGQLGVAFSVKKEVLSYPIQTISHRAEVEEIRSKIDGMAHLTVTALDEEEREYPLGVLQAADIMKSTLGTVSLRDFCNRDETKIPSYFEVISVIDHHKSILQTSAAPVAIIADAQSANALVAEMSFAIHDSYTKASYSEEAFQQELSKLDPSQARIIQRMLYKHSLSQKNQSYYIDPSREYLEYLHYLYAILDDTDLLSKVSCRDVLCVASLLNRLKTLSLGKETEIISFDDLAQDKNFALQAAKRILQNDDMYSLYKKIYLLKEEAVEESLHKCLRKEESTVFADTKAQNGCCRVGQSKFFAKNFSTYLAHREEICLSWVQEAKKYYEENGDCDLYMHMISTIPSADDVYAGQIKEVAHKDELWIWIPSTEQAIGHLKSFLEAFRHSAEIAPSAMEVAFPVENQKMLEQIFHESFKSFTKVVETKMSVSVAVIQYKAGLLNSRKAMVSPYLPKLIK